MGAMNKAAQELLLREEGFNAEYICDRPVFGDRYETRKELKEREIDN